MIKPFNRSVSGNSRHLASNRHLVKRSSNRIRRVPDRLGVITGIELELYLLLLDNEGITPLKEAYLLLDFPDIMDSLDILLNQCDCLGYLSKEKLYLAISNCYSGIQTRKVASLIEYIYQNSPSSGNLVEVLCYLSPLFKGPSYKKIKCLFCLIAALNSSSDNLESEILAKTELRPYLENIYGLFTLFMKFPDPIVKEYLLDSLYKKLPDKVSLESLYQFSELEIINILIR